MLGLRYIEKVEQAIDQVQSQAPAFGRATRLIVDGVLKGGHLYIHDPGNMISSEALIRSGGLVMLKKLRISDFSSANLTPNDTVAVFLKRSRLSGDLTFIQAIKRCEARIVGVFPSEMPHAGPSLCDFSDIVIDNGLVSEGGILEVDGFDEPICPLDVVINSIIVFALSAEIIGEFLSRGLKPSVFMSGRALGGQEFDQRILEQYARQGY